MRRTRGGELPTDALEIRALQVEDYDRVHQLWGDSEGVGVGLGDSAEGVRRFVARNEGLSLVATRGGRMVAAVLCGHDGRRGFIYHLAVAADQRRTGIGRTLVRRCLDELAVRGIERCQVFVFAENEGARAFWQHVGGRLREDLVVFSLTPGSE